MTTIRIQIPSPPPQSHAVRIVSGSGEIARGISARYPGEPLFLVSDRNVFTLYGRELSALLRARGADLRSIVLPAGERSKSPRTKAHLDGRLLAAGIRRDSVVIAVGGGVIGDLAGFSAATVLRGVRLVQIPTTLLAQVDSSVGGKVGINHPLGKNLVGAFYQPDAVYLSPSMLRTLSDRDFRSGIGEVIKYGMILDARLFRRLETAHRSVVSRRPGTMADIVERCIRLKASVVAADEREADYRRILNFGHTVGHAVEQLTRYRLPHGYAVAIGMAVEGEMACATGLLRPPDLERLRRLLVLYGLPASLPADISPRRILTLVSRDKKNTGGSVRFTLVRGIGKGKPGVIVPEKILLGILRR